MAIMKKGGGGKGRKTHVVDELLDAVAQLVFAFLPVQRVVDRREGRVDAVLGGAPHVTDEIDQVFGRLQLYAAVDCGVHVGYRFVYTFRARWIVLALASSLALLRSVPDQWLIRRAWVSS